MYVVILLSWVVVLRFPSCGGASSVVLLRFFGPSHCIPGLGVVAGPLSRLRR
jgi:hypothetical protein